MAVVVVVMMMLREVPDVTEHDQCGSDVFLGRP